MRPICVAILDTGGHLQALKREDGATFMRPRIAAAKAWGALGMGRSSRALGERFADRLGFLTALAVMSEGNFVPVAGGILVCIDGNVAGAVGVSGGSSDEDEACALEGVRAAGLEVCE
jgi:uncharacterized protein GlcG (DUF336 family)